MGISKETITQEQYFDARMRVDPWIEQIDKTGRVEDISPDDLLTILRFNGTREVNSDQLDQLSKHKLIEVRKGLEAVWGNERLDQFEVLMAGFSASYNATEGNRRLPMSLSSFSGETGLGNRRLFLELTQLAYGVLDNNSFKERTEAALTNGILWQQRRDEERVLLPDPDSTKGELKKVNQIAPGFISHLYNWITNS
jgi:hypothetical protein